MYKICSFITMLMLTFFVCTNFAHAGVPPSGIIVLQTDFGLKDGAVNAIKGVIYSTDKSLIVVDLTHEIPPFNIWEASYWLSQVASYWPKGTVFVSVVDPGVGTNRRSVVAESENGYYFVTPDNGTLTMISNSYGLKEIRQINEATNRLPGSYKSYTFHGRDVYGYTAAKLAAGKIDLEQVGSRVNEIVKLTVKKPFLQNNKLHGTIVVLDPEYGNVWTNIDSKLVKQLQVASGKRYKISIYHKNKKKHESITTFQTTFGKVKKGETLIYLNSLLNLAIGINQGDFAKQYHISSGPDWTITIEKLDKN